MKKLKQLDLTKIDLTRPDKLLLSGLRTLGNLSLNLYSEEKSESKGRGEITFIGKKKVEKVQNQLYVYDEKEAVDQEEIADFGFFDGLDSGKVHWLNVHGLHEVAIIENIARALDLDRITLKQTLDTTLRPKVEEYDHYLFFSVKSVLRDDDSGLQIEQMSFVLGQSYVVSFQEERGDHFDHIRHKIKEGLGIVRKKGTGFLIYQLLDAILDNYFETIENANLEMRELEKIIFKRPSQASLVHLERMKQDTEMIKKSLTPFKDALKVILNRQTPFIDPDDNKYFQDLMNNCESAIEEIDSTSKSLEGLTNIYFSSLSQKMNETMKVLTTVATIFIPLTFIAGVYGMNFENMPELKNPNGYFYTWGVMGFVFIGMIIYFKRKNWL